MGIRDVLADPERERKARKAFGAALKAARLEKGWTQEMAGRAVGVSRAPGVTFNQWENGKSFPRTGRLLIAIRDVLGVDAYLAIVAAEAGETQTGVRSLESGGENKEIKGPRSKRRYEQTGRTGGLRISDAPKNMAVLEAFNRLDPEGQILIRGMIERLDGKGKRTKRTKRT